MCVCTVCLTVCQADQKVLAISLKCRDSPCSLGGGQINFRCAAGSVPPLCLQTPKTTETHGSEEEERDKRTRKAQGR